MKTKRMMVALVGVWLSVGFPARGEFVPGHIFVSVLSDTFCIHQPKFGPDQIWEIDPQTGDLSLFRELPECVHLNGLTFTPDGTRLRASALVPNQILEFDSEGNISVALYGADGIASPNGVNNIAYDAGGNFYVTNMGTATLMRFPVEGGPGTVIADFCNGIRQWTAIALAADGDLYVCPGGDGCIVDSDRFLLRFAAPDWEVSIFGVWGGGIVPRAVAADRAGYVYVRQAGLGGNVLRYRAGDASSVEVLASEVWGGLAFTMSPHQTHLYATNVKSGSRVLAIDVRDGTVTLVAELESNGGGGIAVVPFQTAPGDFDLDGDVDLDDFAAFDACVTGPQGLIEPACGLGDLDRDLDIDLADLALLQLHFTGL